MVAVAMEVARRCRACGQEMGPRAETCWSCGTAVAAAPAARRAPRAAHDADGLVAFLRGLAIGAAVVLVPFAFRLVLLAA